MPVISFSQKDILRGKVVTPDWYVLRVDSVGEAPSANGQSINYNVEATLIRNASNGSTDFAGVPIDWNFNSKALGFVIPFVKAIEPNFKPEAGSRIDLNAAVGKELEVMVENDTWQNRIVNRVNHKYRPLSAPITPLGSNSAA